MSNISEIFDLLNPSLGVSLTNNSVLDPVMEPDSSMGAGTPDGYSTTTSSPFFDNSTFFPVILNNLTNISSTPIPPGAIAETEPMPTWKIVLILIPLLLISLTIILGNLLVIVSVFTQKSLRSPQNMYIVSLAAADMAVAILVLPFNITSLMLHGVWKWGPASCKLYLLVDVSLCTASILHLCAIAVDRYRAITDGINYIQKRSLQSILSIIACLWVISFWIGTEPVLDSRVGAVEYECELPWDFGHQLHLAIGALFFPLCIMSYLYYRIYQAIKERLRERSKVNCVEVTSDYDTTENRVELSSVRMAGVDGEPSSTSNGGTSTIRKSGKRKASAQISAFLVNKKKFSLSRERKAARTLGLIMGAFIICWLPLGFLNIIASLLPEEHRPSATMFHILTWLGYINSGLNPIIYAASSQDFQKGFRRVLHID